MKKLFIILPICVALGCTNQNTEPAKLKYAAPAKRLVVVNTIPPELDSLMFNKIAVDCFYNLGYSTNGEFYYCSALESVHNVILEVLRDHGANGADILFLIDKTGSMENDLDSMKVNLNLIIDQINLLKNIRLGIAAYGDRNTDSSEWFSLSLLSQDYNQSRAFIQELQVSGGGDYPESVYDGIAATIQQSTFRKDAQKIILVIGDAPSLEDSLSNYNRESIIELCTKNEIKVNLFPILISSIQASSKDEAKIVHDRIVQKVYPNPATDIVNIVLINSGLHSITLSDLTGKVILTDYTNTKEVTINIPSGIKRGNYVLSIIRNEDLQMCTEQIVINSEP